MFLLLKATLENLKSNLRHVTIITRNHILSTGVDPDISEAVFVEQLKRIVIVFVEALFSMYVLLPCTCTISH